MSTSEKEFETITNAGQTINLLGKQYMLKAPSLKVTFAVLKRVKIIFEIAGISIEKLRDCKTVEEVITYILQAVYSIMFSERSDEVLKAFSEITAMILANRTVENLRKTDLQPSTIENEIPLDEFMPIFLKVIEMSDMQNFLLTIIRLAQTQDMFQMLSDGQK